MIKITVELLPKGDASRTRKLAEMTITNDGTGDLITGSYRGILHAEYTGPNGRAGRVVNFHRKSQSVWSLVGAFLKGWGHTSHSPKYINPNEQNGGAS